MKRILERFARLLAERKAATAIEYGLIVALIALGALASMQGFGSGLGDLWEYVSSEVLAGS